MSQGLQIDETAIFARIGRLTIENELLREQLGKSQQATIAALGEANKMRIELEHSQYRIEELTPDPNVDPEPDLDMSAYESDVGQVNRFPTTLHSAEMNGVEQHEPDKGT